LIIGKERIEIRLPGLNCDKILTDDAAFSGRYNLFVHLGLPSDRAQNEAVLLVSLHYFPLPMKYYSEEA